MCGTHYAQARRSANPQCSIPGCYKPQQSKNLCMTHYQRLRLHGDPYIRYFSGRKASTALCKFEGCTDKVKSRGWCQKHYIRWWKHQDPAYTRKRMEQWNSHGYWMESCPDHPLADKQGMIFVHRRVLYDALGQGPHPCHECGQPLEWGSELHVDHLNEDKGDNRLSNLAPACPPCNRLRSAILRRDERRKKFKHA